MDFRKIQAFIALTEEKNFSRAADKVYMAQSSLSAQIVALEKELGVTLVTREHHRVELTPEGEIFLNYCYRWLSDYQELQAQLRPFLPKKTVTIGLFYSSRIDAWSETIARKNAEEGTRVSYEISVLYKQEKLNALRKHEIPIGLHTRSTELEESGFHFCHVFSDAIHVGVHRSNPLSQKAVLSGEDCRKLKYLIIDSRRTQVEQSAIQFLQDVCKVKKSQFVVKDRLDQIYYSMKNGQFACLLPKDLMPEEVAACRLDWAEQPQIEYGWYYDKLTPELQWIIDNLK